jgi:glycosyltransferase involved in cell wall biosynthesis
LAKVCFFNSTPFWGGGEKWHLENAIALARRGHVVVVVGRSGSPLLVRAREAGLETAGFPITSIRWLDPLLLARLRSFFVRRQTQAVVFNGSLDIKVGGLAAKAAGVPRRVYRRGVALPIRDRWLNRYLFDHVLTHVIANSEATRETMLRDIRTRFRRPHVPVMPNGLDLDAFDRRPFRPVFERAEGQVVLGNVGRLTKQKGHEILLEVAHLLRSRGVAFRLLVAGAGDLHRELMDRARELGVQSHVEFLGFVDDVPGFLAGIDIFLLSSLWEGFGYVITEAGAASLPVVAFDVSSNPEIIEHGTTGYLVPFGDVSAFAGRVQELIERPDLRRTMGAAARAAVERRFRLDRTVDRLERLLLD